MMFPSGVYAQGSDLIKVGVVGTGGRGTGAISNVLMSAEGVEITAPGDSEPGSPRAVARHARQGSRRQRCLARATRPDSRWPATGCTPASTPTSRSWQRTSTTSSWPHRRGSARSIFAAAVAAGKHIFTEKPVGTDSAGIRSVLATYEADDEALDRGRHAAPPPGRALELINRCTAAPSVTS